MDNNILNAPDLEQIVKDLCEAGFARDAKFSDPGAYSIIMERYRRGERGDFLDRKIQDYLNKLKLKIKNEQTRVDFIQMLIDGEEASDYAEYMPDIKYKMSPIVEKYRSKAPRARFLDFNQGIDGRKINDENMKLLAQLAIKPLRIAFDDIAMKDMIYGK